MPYCTSCGSEVNAAWRFCRQCGQATGVGETASPPANPSAGPPQAAWPLTTAPFPQPYPPYPPPRASWPPPTGMPTGLLAYRPSGLGFLGGWLEGLCWGAVAAAILWAGLALALTSEYDDFLDQSTTIASEELIDAEERTAIGLGLSSVIDLAATVVLVVWTWRAYRQAASPSVGGLRLRAGWAIAGWLIPLANFVIPVLILRDISRLTRTVDHPERATPGWRGWRRTRASLWPVVWAVVTVAALVTFFPSAETVGYEEGDFLRPTDDGWQYTFGVVSALATGTGWAALALYARRTRRGLNKLADRLTERAPERA